MSWSFCGAFFRGIGLSLIVCAGILSTHCILADEGGGSLPIPCPNHPSRDECKNPGQACWVNGQAGLCAWDNVAWKCDCDPI